MFDNGTDVVKYFEKMLKDPDLLQRQDEIQPVSLLLLDINMPILTGMEAIKLIKEKYQQSNDMLNSSITPK